MVREHLLRRRAPRYRAQEEKETGNDFLIGGKIFGSGYLGDNEHVGFTYRLAQRSSHALREFLVVRRDVVTARDRDSCAGAAALGDRLGRIGDAPVNVLAHVLVERPDGPDHFDRVRNDVRAITAIDGADRDHGRLYQYIHLPAGYGLKTEDDLRCDHDGVDTEPRQRTMSLFAF